MDTWQAFEQLVRRRARPGDRGLQLPAGTSSAGCSTETRSVPAVNQVELHPGLQQQELRAFHGEHGIVTEAWSPLGPRRSCSRIR